MNNRDFLYPVLLNIIIDCNLMVSKFSPHAGSLQTPAIELNMFNNNVIFNLVSKGESFGKLINLETRGRDMAENEMDN